MSKNHRDLKMNIYFWKFANTYLLLLLKKATKRKFGWQYVFLIFIKASQNGQNCSWPGQRKSFLALKNLRIHPPPWRRLQKILNCRCPFFSDAIWGPITVWNTMTCEQHIFLKSLHPTVCELTCPRYHSTLLSVSLPVPDTVRTRKSRPSLVYILKYNYIYIF